jgi:hypothetical protein
MNLMEKDRAPHFMLVNTAMETIRGHCPCPPNSLLTKNQ